MTSAAAATQLLADRIALAAGQTRLSELPVERRLAVIIRLQEGRHDSKD